MAKNRNTYAKRSRESDKKRKAQDKIDRRRTRKDQPPVEPPDPRFDGPPGDVVPASTGEI
jgi:hypothetical protein